MDINERRQQLLKILRAASIDVPITVQKISELLRVSPRTIHSDLDTLEEELQEEGWRIVRKSRKGI